jgi:sialate O-acetylesterase
MNFKRLGLGAIVSAITFAGDSMALNLPSVFSDNMVLQRNQEVRIWGESDSDKVAVYFDDQIVSTKVVNKSWEVRLKPMKVNTTAQVLKVRDQEKTVEFKNVLVGDVFFCSGQSNMEMPVTHSSDCKELVANSKNDQIRICSSIQAISSEPLEDFAKGVNGWQEASPESLATSGVIPKRGFSGTSYSFAYHLQKETGVPVGVFVSAWGGVPIHAFTDKDGIKQYKSKVSGKGKHSPSSLYNALVHPITKFNIAGWVWYQGEEDVKVKDYDHRMEVMIERWRKVWGTPNKPFYYVQICPFSYKGVKIEDFWKQQHAVAKNVKNTYMVETEDIGNLRDIHPHNKVVLGKRLADLLIQKSK